jgi:hypothetical protein
MTAPVSYTPRSHSVELLGPRLRFPNGASLRQSDGAPSFDDTVSGVSLERDGLCRVHRAEDLNHVATSAECLLRRRHLGIAIRDAFEQQTSTSPVRARSRGCHALSLTVEHAAATTPSSLR